MAKIKLIAIAKTDKGTIISTGKAEPAIVLDRRANEYVCGLPSCDQVLVICNPGQVKDMIVVCGKCGTYNAVNT